MEQRTLRTWSVELHRRLWPLVFFCSKTKASAFQGLNLSFGFAGSGLSLRRTPLQLSVSFLPFLARCLVLAKNSKPLPYSVSIPIRRSTCVCFIAKVSCRVIWDSNQVLCSSAHYEAMLGKGALSQGHPEVQNSSPICGNLGRRSEM